jgi:hypothetical protein
LLVSEPVDWIPLVALAPDHPPLLVQAVVFALLHVSVELAPLVTVAGLAENDSVGTAGATTTVTLLCVEPPGPLHVSV